MANHNINITGDGTTSTPPVASPSELDLTKPTYESTTIAYNNKTQSKVEIAFSGGNITPGSFSIDANSSQTVTVNAQCSSGKYHYDIHYDGMPGPDSKPYVHVQNSNTSDDGNPAQGTSPTEYH